MFGQHKPCKKCKTRGTIYEHGKERKCWACDGRGYKDE